MLQTILFLATFHKDSETSHATQVVQNYGIFSRNFLQNLFKFNFSLDNKDVQKNCQCELVTWIRKVLTVYSKNDFSWVKYWWKLQGVGVLFTRTLFLGENCRAWRQKFYKKSTFFHKFSFKIAFSLDNKDVRKICHAELDSPSILSLWTCFRV